MKRIIPAVGIALAFAVAASAQTPATPQTGDQTTKPKSSMGSKAMGSKTVTLTGCVKEGNTPNAFVLTNVDLSKMTDPSTSAYSTPPPTHTAPPTQTPPEQTPPPATAGTSGMAVTDTAATVVLIGGADLKQHVGHQVEVTGMMMHGKDKKSRTTGTTGSAAGETTTDTTSRPGEAGRDKNRHTLNVRTVKMVSSTCGM
ncbi:MAG: hypothetical protein HYU53_10300 [Acidobacteria bacterium]|nr:hypothetical protein [Acidobacteriota bacterium]